MTTPLQARPLPHIVTELPGPKARAHVEFDHAWTSPSLPRAYPIVPVRGEGCAIEDIDGNVFLDFAAGIAVNSTGSQPPGRRRGDPGAGREPAPHVGQRLLPADLRGGRRRARAHRPDVRARSGRSSATPAPRRSRPASSSPATTRAARTCSRSSAPSTAGRWARSASRPRRPSTTPTSARCSPGVYHVPFGNEGLEEMETARLQAPHARRRVRRGHRGADPGRGRLRRPRGRLPGAPARAVRPPRDPAHRRRGPVGRRPHREDVGDPALGRRARHPAHGQGHRVRHAGRRDDRQGRRHELGPGRPRLARTAATRSRSRRCSRRSSCSRAA